MQSFRTFFFASLFSLTAASTALAQNVRDYVEVRPPAKWVEVQSLPTTVFPALEELGSRTRLLSYQHRIGETYRDRYTRLVYDLNSASAIEDRGTFDVNFDPTYQSVILHEVKIIRPEGARNVLDLDEFVVFRSETDRSKMMYNGELTISLAIPGLQIGDQLDYAYTVSGKNPALGSGYDDFQTQSYSNPVHRLFSQTLVEEGLPVFVQTLDGGEMPSVEKDGDTTKIRFVRDNVAPFTVDDDRPNWVYGWPLHRVSSYDNWRDVGNHFSQYYKRAETPAVRAVAQKIRDENPDKPAQARAALDYVQRSIRYVALSMGKGGFIPRQPDRVLDRRYGDCKDVTLLLLSLLAELDIEADPMLVDTDELGAVFDVNPSLQAFDHVVVRAEVNGTFYVMDATRNPQLGDLYHFDQGNFGRGLILRDGDSEVVDLKSTGYTYKVEAVDHFDLVAAPGSVLFTNELTYRGDEADDMVDWQAADGLESITESIANYMRDFYPTLTVKKPTEVELDKEKGVAVVRTTFDIPNAWDPDPDDGLQYFRVRPYEIRSDLPQFSGAARTTPFGISYPKSTRQILKIQVDKDYTFSEGEYEHVSDAFAYKELNRYDTEASLYTETYVYQAKRDHIRVEDFKADMAAISDIRARMGITVQTGLETDSVAAKPAGVGKTLPILLILMLTGLLGWLFVSQGKRQRKNS